MSNAFLPSILNFNDNDLCMTDSVSTATYYYIRKSVNTRKNYNDGSVLKILAILLLETVKTHLLLSKVIAAAVAVRCVDRDLCNDVIITLTRKKKCVGHATPNH